MEDRKQKFEEQRQIKRELDPVISELEELGIDPEITDEELQKIGLGDIVEGVLTKWGITQERYKSWMGLQECKCSNRKMWLNNFLSWKVSKKS